LSARISGGAVNESHYEHLHGEREKKRTLNDFLRQPRVSGVQTYSLKERDRVPRPRMFATTGGEDTVGRGMGEIQVIIKIRNIY